MKYLLTILLSLACNQEIYDQIYVQILKECIADNDIKLRNTRILTLRTLCKGQLSTLEEKNKKYPGRLYE